MECRMWQRRLTYLFKDQAGSATLMEYALIFTFVIILFGAFLSTLTVNDKARVFPSASIVGNTGWDPSNNGGNGPSLNVLDWPDNTRGP